MNFPSISEITQKAQSAFKRFPITLVWTILGTIFTIWLFEDSNDRFENNIDILLPLLTGVSWLIGIQFFTEQLKEPKKWFWLKLVILALISAFYWYLPSDGEQISANPEYLMRFALFFLSGHLFVLFAPFLLKWDKTAYWNYLKSMGMAIIGSVFFSGVLYLGLVLAFVAVDALFEVSIRGERYGQLFVFCLGIVNTWIYLSDFPKQILQNKSIDFNRALEVLVKYILIPLVMLYMIILYAYGLKILVEWELPKGWVSYLVTALALLGFLVQVAINPIQKTLKSWTINNFYPWFYYLLLPLIALLFVAIFRRVGDYGITENRYFVIVLSFWILGVTLYSLLAKKQRLIVLPISLFVLVIVSAFGPWGALSVSKNSQVVRFKKVLEEVKTNKNEATTDQHGQLSDILKFLDDRAALSKLDPITGISMIPAFKDTVVGEFKTYNWLDTNKVLDSLNIKVLYDGIPVPPGEVANGQYFYYSNDWNKSYSYDLNQYDYLGVFGINSYQKNQEEIGDFLVVYDHKKTYLDLLSKSDSSLAIRIDMEEKFRSLRQYGQNLDRLTEEQLTINAQNDSLETKLIFKDLNFNYEKDSLNISHSKLFLFLKQK